MAAFIFLTFMLLQASLPKFGLQFFLENALKNNPSIKEYHQQIAVSKLQKELISAQYSTPQIYLTANYLFVPYFNNGGRLIASNPNPNAVGYESSLTNGGLYAAQLNVDKFLFNGAAIDALEEQISIQQDALTNNISVAKHELEKQVTDQYIRTVQSFQLYTLSDTIRTNLNERLMITNELVKHGLVTQSDYLLLQVEADNQKLSLNDSYSQYRTNVNQLFTMCGMGDSAAIELDTLNLPLYPAGETSHYFNKYESDNSLLLNQQRVFESKYSPQVKAFFNTGLNAVEIENIRQKFGLSIGLDFSIPIFDGNQKSITRQQNAMLQQSLREYKNSFANQLQNQRRNSRAQMGILKTGLENISQQSTNYRKVIDLSERQLQRGQISMIEYLTVLKNFNELRKNKINSEANYQLLISDYNYWNW